MRRTKRKTKLTPKEKSVLGFFANGLSDEVIAERMGISKIVVTRYIYSIMDFLDVDSRQLLALYVARNGIQNIDGVNNL